ncbi:MAG: hypothetical protein AB8H79_16525 [Myxococcota bacterium]
MLLPACSGREDLGVPNTWGLETMRFQEVQVHETTCGEGPLPWFVGWQAIVNVHDPIRDVPSVGVVFDDPDSEAGRRYSCRSTAGANDTWSLDCHEGQTSLGLEEGFDGAVTTRVRGAFLGPSSLRMDLRYQIIECGDPERCEPYTMDYSTFYEAD